MQQLNEVAKGFDIIFGKSLEAEQTRNAIGLAAKQRQLEDMLADIKKIEDAASKSTGMGVSAALGADAAEKRKEADALQASIDQAMKNYNRLNAEISKNQEAAKTNQTAISSLATSQKALSSSSSGVTAGISSNSKALSAASKEAEKASKNIADLKTKWAEFVSGEQQDTLKSQIEDAIDALNRPKLDGLKKELETILRTDFMNDWKEAIESGAVGFEEVQRAADDFVAKTSNDIEKEFGDAGKAAASKMGDEFQQLGDIVGSIGSLFGGDKSQISQSTQGAAQDMAAALNPIVAIIKAVWETYKNIKNASQINKQTKSERGTGEAIGGLFGDLGKEIGGEIGAQFKWGAQEFTSRARKAYATFIQETLEKLGSVTFKDAQGQTRTMRGRDFDLFLGSTSRFNKPGWAEEMNKWGEESKATFLGLGESIKQLLGITDDVGGQMAFILGEQLSGNIDNARLLVAQLGLSFEDLQEAMFQAALQGKITFAEFEIGITNAANAFKPGLEAVNDLSGAMDQLVGSGGRGVAALMAVRNAAVEAMEGGARTLEQLGAQMLAQGVDPSLVDSFMLALKERGIKTLEELANASDRVAAGIVAELTSNDEALRNQWAQMTQDLKGLAETIESIPREKDIKINVRTEFDKNTQQFISAGGMSMQTGQKATPFANGGVINGPMAFGYGGGKLGVAGEAGAEAIMPLTRIGGKLGVLAVGGQGAAGNVYHIDARGADIGVERRIRAALMDVEDRAVRRSLNAMGDNSRRGGRF